MTDNLCDWFNRPSSTDLRIYNCSEDIIKFLSELKIKYKPSPKSNNFIRIKSDLNKIISSNHFKSGNINIQGRASGAVVELLAPKPNSVVLDVCAAPGTKSIYIYELMKKKKVNFFVQILILKE